MGIM
jgi:hypothetical protein